MSKRTTLTIAAALAALTPLAVVSLSQAQEQAMGTAPVTVQDPLTAPLTEPPGAETTAASTAPAAEPTAAEPSAATAAAPAAPRTRTPAVQIPVAASPVAETDDLPPAEATVGPLDRAEVKQAFQDARRRGMLLGNGEAAEPDAVLAAREAYNERQTVAIARLSAERTAQWVAYREAVARYAAWQREQELLATQKATGDEASVASAPGTPQP